VLADFSVPSYVYSLARCCAVGGTLIALSHGQTRVRG